MSTLRNASKFGPQRSGMTHAKWLANQTIHKESGTRVIHQSAVLGTYNVGRNAVKRVKKAVAAVQKMALTAPRFQAAISH